MHELSIAQALLEQLRRVAEREGADRVLSVTVRIGALAGVDAEALEMAFPVAAAGTLAEGATLRIEAVPARVHCTACGRDSAPPFPFLVCDACGSGAVHVESGRELDLVAAELRQP